MLILIVLSSIFSVLIAFLSGTIGGNNAFFNYYIVLFNFLATNWFFITVSFVFCCFIFLWRVKLPKEYSIKKRISTSIFQVSSSIFVGTFFAYILLLIIAWTELNALAFIIDISPSLLGINSNISSIVSTIKTSSTVPQIIASDTDNYQELLGVATATTGTSNVYGGDILSSIPSLLVLPIIESSSSMMMIDNTLIVNKINRSDLQKVSPVIGYLLIQQYFPTRKIKLNPTVQVLSPQEYQKIRKSEYIVKLGKIDIQLKVISSDIASLSAGIALDKDQVSADQSQIDTTNKQNTTQYTACMNAGYYNSSNEYIRTNSSTYCQNLLSQLQESSQNSVNDQSKWQQQLDFNQQQLTSYEYYQNFFATQKELMQVNEVNIPSELGLFVPPHTLQIITSSSGTHIIPDYFETLAHEYLHYTSYIPGKSFTSSFFEEGLTEYFARRTIKDNLNIDTNVGYPVYVKIITQMTKDIPESDLADIYFSKDDNQLKATLDRVYGDGFYDKNLITFETLQYASDPDQILYLANMIMKQIGGTPLTINDLKSSITGL